ncbi:uncharacterized protein G2W53_017306 [Senna tora]|uniref:Uncharacterized protein n=1 Tax=Senna tora TaxID=362788 RepID=A0A834TQI9_9FABA|nr:uncharacterized protein G2W53_017306 [Senna tora]
MGSEKNDEEEAEKNVTRIEQRMVKR